MQPFLLLVLAALSSVASARVYHGYEETDPYKRVNAHLMICYPQTLPSDELTPPCISIDQIERTCHPNGTTPPHYARHAECICKGSFFQDWLGCQACMRAHGLRSERDVAYWADVARVVSTDLCTGTPVADFAVAFDRVINDPNRVPYPTTGDTASVDEFPSQTAASLYYTLTVTQGPGVMTIPDPEATRRQYGFGYDP